MSAYTIRVNREMLLVSLGVLLVLLSVSSALGYNDPYTGCSTTTPDDLADPTIFGHTADEIAWGGDVCLPSVHITGNLSIGTMSPGYEIDVVGDINAQNALCIGGDCRVAWPTGGGVIQVDTGQGLTGGPITTTGNISVQDCPGGQILKSCGADCWNCQPDDIGEGGIDTRCDVEGTCIDVYSNNYLYGSIIANPTEDYVRVSDTLYVGIATVPKDALVYGDLRFYKDLMPDGANCANDQILKKTDDDDWDCVDYGGDGSTEMVFKTMNAPSGTDPVADSSEDTLNLVANTGVDITGDSATDTITIVFDCSDVDGTGLVCNAAEELYIAENYRGADARCTGTNVYLDGDGNCDTISGGGDITDVNGGSGLDPDACSSGSCTLNVNTNLNYGTQVTSDIVALRSCVSGEILKSCGVNCWNCQADDTGGGSLWSEGTSSRIYYNDGNVGIGTNVPTQKLSVFGTVWVTEDVLANRDLVVSDDVSFYGELMPDGTTCSNGQIVKKTGDDNWDCVDATGFDIHDDVTSSATISGSDRIVFSDESASGDPNRYTTFTNFVSQLPSSDFDLHDDVTTSGSIADADHILFSDESASGDPNRYVAYASLKESVLAATSLYCDRREAYATATSSGQVVAFSVDCATSAYHVTGGGARCKKGSSYYRTTYSYPDSDTSWRGRCQVDGVSGYELRVWAICCLVDTGT